MRVCFNLNAANVVECQWAIFTGHERYLHNGVEVLSLRSFALTGSREFSVNVDGEVKNIRIAVCFRPSLKTLCRSNGLIAAAYVDDVLWVSDLLEPQYRIRSWLAKLLMWFFPFLLVAIPLFILVNAPFFNERMQGLNKLPLPLSIEIINAATATPDCRQTLDEFDSSLLLSEKESARLRLREMNRTSGWVIDDHRTAISTIVTIYSQVSPVCQRSIRELLDQYLINGADINQRFSTFNMTVLESAIIGGEADAVCMLLSRGSSLNEKAGMRRGDGQASRITGMTLLEAARELAERQKEPYRQQVLANIEQFLETGSCSQI